MNAVNPSIKIMIIRVFHIGAVVPGLETGVLQTL